MATITLYELPGCPFCIKVSDKLDELGIEYETEEVPGAHGQRTEVEAISGQTGVPVIVDEEHDIDGMAESSQIVKYLEETYGN